MTIEAADDNPILNYPPNLKYLFNCRPEIPSTSSNGKHPEGESLRPITSVDFKQALGKMKESRVYNRQAEALLKMDLD